MVVDSHKRILSGTQSYAAIERWKVVLAYACRIWCQQSKETRVTFVVTYLYCCFLGAAFKEFQSAPLTAARVQTIDLIVSPKRGTTLLCSSTARTVSVAPRGGVKYTMFSGALLLVRQEGAAKIETPPSNWNSLESH